MEHHTTKPNTEDCCYVIAGQREQITSATITIDTHTDTHTNTYTDTDASTDFCSLAKGKKQRINPNNFDLNEYTQFKSDALRSISIHYKKKFLFPCGATKSRDCWCFASNNKNKNK